MDDCPACASYPPRIQHDIDVAGRNFHDALAGHRHREGVQMATVGHPWRPFTITAGSDAYTGSPA